MRSGSLCRGWRSLRGERGGGTKQRDWRSVELQSAVRERGVDYVDDSMKNRPDLSGRSQNISRSCAKHHESNVTFDSRPEVSVLATAFRVGGGAATRASWHFCVQEAVCSTYARDHLVVARYLL